MKAKWRYGENPNPWWCCLSCWKKSHLRLIFTLDFSIMRVKNFFYHWGLQTGFSVTCKQNFYLIEWACQHDLHRILKEEEEFGLSQFYNLDTEYILFTVLSSDSKFPLFPLFHTVPIWKLITYFISHQEKKMWRLLSASIIKKSLLQDLNYKGLSSKKIFKCIKSRKLAVIRANSHKHFLLLYLSLWHLLPNLNLSAFFSSLFLSSHLTCDPPTLNSCSLFQTSRTFPGYTQSSMSLYHLTSPLQSWPNAGVCTPKFPPSAYIIIHSWQHLHTKNEPKWAPVGWVSWIHQISGLEGNKLANPMI